MEKGKLNGGTAMIVFGIIIAVIGSIFIVAFAISRARCKTRIEATVSRLATKSMKLRGRTVTDTTPIFTYTAGGEEYTYKAEMSTSNRKRFTVGQKEFIFINEKHPNEARYGSNFGFLLCGIVCVLLGTAVIVLSMM